MSDVTDVIAHELTRLESETLDATAARASYIAVLAPLLERSGYPVSRYDLVPGVDFVGRAPEPDSDSWFTTLGVVLKYGSRDQAVGVSQISGDVQVLARALDRLLIVSNAGFTTHVWASAQPDRSQHLSFG